MMVARACGRRWVVVVSEGGHWATATGTCSAGDNGPPAKYSVGPTLPLQRPHHGPPCSYNHAEIQSALPTHPPYNKAGNPTTAGPTLDLTTAAKALVRHFITIILLLC